MSSTNPVLRTVLVADDNIADQEMVRRAFALTNVPVDLEAVEDGEQALFALGINPELASENDDVRSLKRLPDLLLLDLNLPRLSGRDVLKAIRTSERHCHLPVLILSGSAHPDDVLWCYRNGCNGYIQKSDFRAFRNDVQRLAEFWLNTALLPGQFVL